VPRVFKTRDADTLTAAFTSPLFSFYPADFGVGIFLAVALRLVIYIKGRDAKRFRKNVEYGSARWGTPKDIKPYIDPVFVNNVILTQSEWLMMNNRPKGPKTARNKNVLIIGGSGLARQDFG
jgi:type IV secretion system protein VirD4